jgi:hypothetical protein
VLRKKANRWMTATDEIACALEMTRFDVGIEYVALQLRNDAHISSFPLHVNAFYIFVRTAVQQHGGGSGRSVTSRQIGTELALRLRGILAVSLSR